MNSNEPLTHLDEKLDALTVALAQTPDLPGLITGISGYEALLRFVSPHHPAAAEAVAVSAVWKALTDVATEVLTLRHMKENN